MTKTVRAIAATAISIIALILPQHGQADSLLRRTNAPEFVNYLPRFDEVPWLRMKATAFTPRRYALLPEAGSVSALLFTPPPAPVWPRYLTQAAEAASRSVEM